MKLKNLAIGVAVLLLTSVMAFGQAVNGSLLGTITDATGASMPNTKVLVTEANTGTSRNTTTNESGNFSFPDLPPGTYSVVVEQTGFKKTTRANVDVLVNSTVR